jgi:hypothetical protein
MRSESPGGDATEKERGLNRRAAPGRRRNAERSTLNARVGGPRQWFAAAAGPSESAGRAGLKSPLAALVKSQRGERRRKRPGAPGQMGDREMNASEPLMKYRKGEEQPEHLRLYLLPPGNAAVQQPLAALAGGEEAGCKRRFGATGKHSPARVSPVDDVVSAPGDSRRR